MKPTSKSWKDSISSDACLMYFNSSKPVLLQVDASKLGLGGVLQENNHGKLRPVAYASKCFTLAETRYANIEREMLAVVWGYIKFNNYLCGRKFVCQSDHKPLEDIHLKYLSDAAPRWLQRLLLKLQPYDVAIKYVPGSYVPVADALSRVIPSGRTEIKGLDITIHEITPDLSHIQVETIQQATKSQLYNS